VGELPMLGEWANIVVAGEISEFLIVIAFAHVKHVVGESEDGSNDFFERFLTGFA
jgi:hypothetical protein